MKTGTYQAPDGARVEIATPAAARAVVRETVGQVVAADVLDTALLLVGEIVGNAFRHGRPPVLLRVALRGHASTLRVEVDDKDPQRPLIADPALLDEGGRGRWLVNTLSAGWGVEEHQNDGKTVWFELAA